MASEPGNVTNPDMVKLANAPEDIVRAVLIALCQDLEQERKAIEYLKKLQEFKSKQPRPDESSATSSTGSGASNDDSRNGGKPNKKRAASDIRICEECQEPFSEDDNPEDACEYHPGSLEMDDDASVWNDWEDFRQGDRFSKETEESYPQGFTWDCCNRRGDTHGCTRGPHSVHDKRPYRGGPTGHTID